MGKYSSGVGLDGVIVMMRALGVLHSGAVSVTLSPDGTGSDTGAVVECRMDFDVLPGSSLPDIVSTGSKWPCKDHTQLWDHVYEGLYKLDQEISRVYKQESLWEK